MIEWKRESPEKRDSAETVMGSHERSFLTARHEAWAPIPTERVMGARQRPLASRSGMAWIEERQRTPLTHPAGRHLERNRLRP